MNRKHVLVGAPLDKPIPNENVAQQIYDSFRQRKRDEIAFKNDITDEWISVGKVLDDSARLSVALTNMGLSSNNLVAICGNNHINYPTIIFGALAAGVPLALMSPVYTEYELENLFNIIEPDVVFCSEINMEMLSKLKPKTKTLKSVVVIDTEEPAPGVVALESFISPSISSQISSVNFPIKKVNAKEHLSFILFSSGTTGLPKAVALNHYGVSGTLIGLNHPDLVLPIEPDVGLGILPFFHIYGLYVVLQTVIKRKPLMILEHFNPFDYLRCIEKYKIDVIIGVPMLLQFLAKSPIVDDYDLSSVKEATCASAPIGEDTIQELKDRLKIQTVRQGYGCTEAHMLVTISPAKGAKPGSVGKVAPGMKMFIRDVKTGESLPANKEGEICSMSDMVMKGYYKNDAATRETFTEDGWLRSGDIGYYDEDGHLFIIDRMKELIKYKGFQVAPAELEAVLMKNPKIADAGVIGKPDKVAGEVPIAFVVKQEDAELTENEVKSYVAGFLTQRKHLHEVYFIDEIPRTRSGKIMRRELKKILETMMKSKL